MIILRVFGGLGNQMFQYSLYLSLRMKRKDVLLDCSLLDYERYNCHKSSIFNSFELSRESDIWFNGKRSEENIVLLKKALKKIKNDELKYYFQNVNDGFDENFFKIDDVYAEGYWQNENYFIDCIEEVRNAFIFKNTPTGFNEKVLGEIKKSKYPVSIHIRERL